MEIKYMVTHCYRKSWDNEETWHVLNVFDKVEDAITWQDKHSVSEGFLFIDVSWIKEKAE